jgi:hypothetical protein
LLPIPYTRRRGKILDSPPHAHGVSFRRTADRRAPALFLIVQSAAMLATLLALGVHLLVLLPDTAGTAVPTDSAEKTARPAASSFALETRMSGIGVWVGGSPMSMTLIAKTKGARFGLVGIEFEHVLATEKHMAVRYTADLIPAAVLAFPPPPRPEGASAETIAPAASPIYGVGVVPAGLQFIYRTHRRVQPFFGGSGGLMAFPSPIPDGRGRKLNYTFDISVGLRRVLSADRVLTIGYRFHHLSNGFRGDINPGFDANIFFIGLSTL